MIYDVEANSKSHTLLDQINFSGRLLPEEGELEVLGIPVFTTRDGTHFIQLEHYIKLMEQDESLIVDLIHKYNLDEANIKFIVDEARIINNPKYLKSKRRYVDSSRIAVRPKKSNTRVTRSID